MTITVNINNKLIDTFLSQLLPTASVRLTNFIIKKKSQYERGDADSCLQLTAKITIECIVKVYKQRKLTPDRTIAQLIDSPNTYSIGSLAVLVAGYTEAPTGYQLLVKDGESASDTATLTMPKNHSDVYATLQQLLPTTSPLLLFKNIVRNGAHETHLLKSTLSTFVDELNDDCSKASLQNLASSNIQVTGTLKTKNAHLPPYQPLCSIYHHIVRLLPTATDNSTQCLTCATSTPFTYEPYLQCTIETVTSTIDCNLHTTLLQEIFPQLAKIPFENYKKDISTVVFLMRKFQMDATFTIAMNNSIIHIAKDDNEVTLSNPPFLISLFVK
ncbi:uncharacterized protein LOC131041407 isoform X1 [Cryptomeria japonica]|uniref:uncharacterized protein LOC131041407 isoform X1 n=1 Tax=Cryptomeria japonica TaxID=3369 RepID=UPI0027DA389A|nr:uncharacterized protein LOC131041407 isoform X1 [Cryptomeria japonica]XP_059069914.1 uncharacterized protein LOC131041407 isoform X1 [Cryptomeria japonica]